MSEVLSTYFLSCPPGERFDLRRQVLDGMGRLSLCYGQLGWEIVGKLWETVEMYLGMVVQTWDMRLLILPVASKVM